MYLNGYTLSWLSYTPLKAKTKPNQPTKKAHFKTKPKLSMVAHAFNASTWEAEAGEFMSSRPAWSTEWVPGQPGLYRETLSWKAKNKQTNKQKKNYVRLGRSLSD